MSDSISLGSIRASVGLDLSPIRRDVGEVGQLMQRMSANMIAGVQQAVQNTTRNLQNTLSEATGKSGLEAGQKLGSAMSEGTLQSLKQMASRISPLVKGAVREAQMSVWGATLDKSDVQRLKIQSQYDRDVSNGVPTELAKERRDLSLKAMEDRERQERERLRSARLEVGVDGFSRQRLQAQKGFDKTLAGTDSAEIRGEAALLFQEQIQEINRRQRESVKKKMSAMLSKSNDFLKGQGSSELWSDEAERRKQGFAILGAGLRQQYRQSQEQRRRERASQQQDNEGASERAFEYRQGQLSLEDYRGFLSERLRSLREQTPEWRRTYEQLQRVNKDALKQMNEQFRQGGHEGAGNMADGIGAGSNLVRNAMSTLAGESLLVMSRNMRRGMQNVFGEILVRTLTSLLSDVLDNAISGIFRKRKKQEKKQGFVDSLVGGLLSPVLGFLGFDDAANDGQARTWGFDFAKHFTRGVSSFQAQRGGVQLVPANPTPTMHLNVTYGDVTVRSEQDIDEIARQIAWRTEQVWRTR